MATTKANLSLASTWDTLYGPTRVRIPDSPRMPPEYDPSRPGEFIQEFDHPNWVWLQPDGTLGPFATRVTNPWNRRARRIVYSEEPLEWERNFLATSESSPYDAGRTPEYWASKVNAIEGRGGVSSAGDPFILVVGCETGGLLRAFLDAGYVNAYGMENSGWHNADRASRMWDVAARIADVDLDTPNRDSVLRQVTGGVDRFDFVIAFDYLIRYGDDQLNSTRQGVTFFNQLGALLNSGDLSRVVCGVVADDGGGLDPLVMNVKEFPQWIAIQPAYTWIETTPEA